LIVMGTKEAHDPLERFMGTHAAEVIDASNVPVLMIPGQQSIFDVHKIGYATDSRSVLNTNRLGYLAAIAEMLQAKVEVFFVASDGASVDFENSENKKVMDRFFESVDHAYVNVEESSKKQGILNHVKEGEIGLLAMIPRQHGKVFTWIHGDTTQYMAQHLSVPLLTLPD